MMLRNYLETTAQRIVALRRQKRMTQGQLAEKLDVSRSCVANWENCIREPNAVDLCMLAACFGVSIEYLCGRTDERSEIKIPKVYHIDFDKLNAEGQKMMAHYYDYLMGQEQYRR